VLAGILLLAVVINQNFSADKMCWIVKVKDGTPVQKDRGFILTGEAPRRYGRRFDINGVKMTYKSLLETYRDGSVKRIKEGSGNAETDIYGGKVRSKNERKFR